jgi:hypothetical protein
VCCPKGLQTTIVAKASLLERPWHSHGVWARGCSRRCATGLEIGVKRIEGLQQTSRGQLQQTKEKTWEAWKREEGEKKKRAEFVRQPLSRSESEAWQAKPLKKKA